MPLSHILRKCSGGYKSRNVQSSNVHRRHQTVCQKRKRIGNPNAGSENIQSRRRDELGIENGIMLIMKSGKRHMTEGMEQPNQEKIRMLGEKET